MKIDWWTLGFQAINVAVLVWLLQHFFWRPIAAMIEQRRTVTEKALANAKATQDKAATAMAEIVATRAGFDKEHDAILATAHAEAEKAGKATRDAAANDAVTHTEAAHAAILAEHDAEEAAWPDRASALAVQIAGRLAARLHGPAINSAFLDWLVSGIQAMPAPARQAAAEADGGFEAVSAAALAPDEQEHARGLITKAFGAQPKVTFRTDPALIAGIELTGPHFALSNSWRADLRQILNDVRLAPGR